MGLGLWGMYFGFELCEVVVLLGKEEYFDLEKYQLCLCDYQVLGNIVVEIVWFNCICWENLVLQMYFGFQVYNVWNDCILYFGKCIVDFVNFVLVVVCLDLYEVQEVYFELLLWEFGLFDDVSFQGEDLMNGYCWVWYGKVQWMCIEFWYLLFGIWCVWCVDV